MDTSLANANVKELNATLGNWHAKRRAWMRSGGLRRQVLVEEEERNASVAQMRQRDLDALYERMRGWQREDDAAVRIQLAWRALQLWRTQRRQLDVTLRLQVSPLEKDLGTVHGMTSSAARKATTAATTWKSRFPRSTTSATSVAKDVSVDLYEVPELSESRADFSFIMQHLSLGIDEVMTPFLSSVDGRAREEAATKLQAQTRGCTARKMAVCSAPSSSELQPSGFASTQLAMQA